MGLIVIAILWTIVAALAVSVAVRERRLAGEGLREGVVDFLNLLPRIAVGVIGAGFVAALLPPELVGRWLGPGSGATGIAAATLAGALTPGGPVLGFSIGAAAFKGGAGAPQVIAYLTAWALFAFPRLFIFELAVMPPRVVWLRLFVSLPVPFLAAAAAMVVGRP